MKTSTTSTATATSRGISLTFPLLVAGLIMRYAVTAPNEPFNWDVAGAVCIIIALLPLTILLGILVLAGLALLVVAGLDVADKHHNRKRQSRKAAAIRRIK